MTLAIHVAVAVVDSADAIAIGVNAMASVCVASPFNFALTLVKVVAVLIA